jgi:hypothetical protein
MNLERRVLTLHLDRLFFRLIRRQYYNPTSGAFPMNLNSPSLRSSALALGLAIGLTPLQAALVNLPGSFTPAAPEITFSEVGLGTVNPVYNFLNAGTLGAVTVSFGASFAGQTLTGSPLTLTGSPTNSNPLTLGAGTVSTVSDGGTGAVLAGDGGPFFGTYFGPISVLFSVPVAAVGLEAGPFAIEAGLTTIMAFSADGSVLGSFTNPVTGFQFFRLADSTGAAVIKGISIYRTGSAPDPFSIDNLTFGAGQVIGGVPDTGSTLLLFSAVLGAVMAFRRRLLA